MNRHLYRNAKYMLIANQLEMKMLSGELPPNQPFYSRDELSQLYGISQVTALNVMQELRQRGCIVCHAGRRAQINLTFRSSGLLSENSVKRVVILLNQKELSTEFEYLLFYLKNHLKNAGIPCFEVEYAQNDTHFTSDDILIPCPDAVPPAEGEARSAEGEAEGEAVAGGAAGGAARSEEGEARSAEGEARSEAVAGGAARRITCVSLHGSPHPGTLNILSQQAALSALIHLLSRGATRFVHIRRDDGHFSVYGALWNDTGSNELTRHIPHTEYVLGHSEQDMEHFYLKILPEEYAQAKQEGGRLGVLMDHPYFTEYAEDGLREGRIHHHDVLFEGCMMSGRNSRFPCVNLKLDQMARRLFRCVCACSGNDRRVPPAEFHIPEYENPLNAM